MTIADQARKLLADAVRTDSTPREWRMNLENYTELRRTCCTHLGTEDAARLDRTFMGIPVRHHPLATLELITA